MKRFINTGLLNLLAVACFSQNTNGILMTTVSGADRISMVKNSINVPSWHEKSFWPVYEKYMNKVEGVSSLTYRALDDLAKTDRAVDDKEAYDNATKLIGYRYEELAVRQQYYGEIVASFNGIIALQFLQTESLLDMMESSSIYEQTSWKKFRFHPKAVSPEQFAIAKKNMITNALSLTEEQAGIFWEVYGRYEEECDALLGENYDLISYYSGEASDFTPALARRQGYNFLNVIEREIKLKEKYFHEMNVKAGSSLAARFLAWEDYYSLISKMHAWVEAP